MTTRTIRLGTASPATKATITETLKDLEMIVTRAEFLGIDILLLPEAYLGGYPRGSAFGATIGSRSRAGRDEFLKHWNDAVDLGDTAGDGAGAGDLWVKRRLPPLNPGSKSFLDAYRGDGTREQIERIARKSGVFLVVGCIEKAGGSLYCSVVYVCPNKGMIGKRRKVMPVCLSPPYGHDCFSHQGHIPLLLSL
jgi:nitrilase